MNLDWESTGLSGDGMILNLNNLTGGNYTFLQVIVGERSPLLFWGQSTQTTASLLAEVLDRYGLSGDGDIHAVPPLYAVVGMGRCTVKTGASNLNRLWHILFVRGSENRLGIDYAHLKNWADHTAQNEGLVYLEVGPFNPEEISVRLTKARDRCRGEIHVRTQTHTNEIGEII
jgi:hypothetical protein